MAIWLGATAIFLVAYTANITLMSVLYHRGLAHRAIALSPATARFVARWGHWLTGVDPLSWCCLHRLHHRFADGPGDPHSPVPRGTLAVFTAQVRSYEKVRRALVLASPRYRRTVSDLDLELSWLARRGWWAAPYLGHAAVALAFSGVSGHALWGLAYYFGLLSHPVGGWLVNALGHRYGYRSFPTPDASTNNRAVAWLVGGEGFQNNHHWRPESPSFACRAGEIDWGYGLCRLLGWLGWVRVPDPVPPMGGARAAISPRA